MADNGSSIVYSPASGRLASARAGQWLGVVLLAGCSGNSLLEVTGRVALDNEPVEYGVISFWPADGRGPSAQGIIRDGKYALEVAPGMKKVGIEAVKKVGDHPVAGSDGVTVPVHEPISPERYRRPDQTTLKCEVNYQSNVHDFHLESP